MDDRGPRDTEGAVYRVPAILSWVPYLGILGSKTRSDEIIDLIY